jgi:DNA polymerase III subunit gamma/tau
MSDGAGPLITRYRPQDWEEVIGDQTTLAALRRAIAAPTCPHAFCLVGASGCGKTTVARLIAKEIGVDNVIELDAGTKNTKEDIEQLLELGHHMALSGAGRRMFILNEVHSLSRAAFNSLLTTLEEPPAHLYFALTTTEPNKLPDAVKTRSYNITLDRVSRDDMSALLDAVAAAEGWQVRDDILGAIVSAATGQPRKGLTILQACHDAESVDEVRRASDLATDNDPLTDIFRMLLQGRAHWNLVRAKLAELLDYSVINESKFEQACEQSGRYLVAVMLKAENEDTAKRAWLLLEALIAPASTFDRRAAVIAAVGKMLWS